MQQTQEHAMEEVQKTYYPLPPWENPLAIRFNDVRQYAPSLMDK